MERNANYALVGLISLILFLGVIIFVVWLAKTQFANQYSIYDVDFKGPVRGLSSGGEVFFNGIKVGEVTKLSLNEQDPNRVVARIRTTADAPVRADSTATLEPHGVTGVNYIQISAGTPSRPLLKAVAASDSIPVIHGVQSQIEDLLEGSGDALARTITVLDKTNRLLSDANLANITATLANLKTGTGLIANQQMLLADLDTTLKSVKGTSDQLNALSGNANQLLTGDGRKTLANLDAATSELRTTSEDVRGMVAKLQGPTVQFATTGLPQLSHTVVTLQTAAEDLDRLVNEVERNPRQLLTKPPARQMRVKP